jgi:hypothetical protein
VERAHRPAAREGLVGGGGLGKRLLVERPHDRVDARVDRVQAGQRGLDRLPAGGLTPADQVGQLDRVEPPELGGYDPTS